MSKHIILTGFKGAGKSTVGPRVAAELEVPWYDTDAQVIAEQRVPPEALIRNRGMSSFRAMELRALEAILAKEAGVISAGRGVVATKLGRRALIEATANVYFLDVPYVRLVERWGANKSDGWPRAKDSGQMKNAYETLQPWYAGTADRIVDATKPIDEVVGEIVEAERTVVQTRSL